MRILSGWMAFTLMACSSLAPGISIAEARIECALTVEWVTAEADLVVRGTISRYTPGEAIGPTVCRWDEVTVQVTETLKGPSVGSVSFAVSSPRSTDGSRWRDPETEWLICLVDGSRRVGDPPGPPPCPFILESAYRFDGSPYSCSWTMEFKKLPGSRELQAATNDRRKSAESFEITIHPRPENWNGEPIVNGAVVLVMPIDRQLEVHAQRWARAGEDHLRYEAIRALRRFPSSENVAILKELVSYRIDLAPKIREKRKGSPNFYQIDQIDPYGMIFAVRKEAYKLLSEWDVEVEEPAVEAD